MNIKKIEKEIKKIIEKEGMPEEYVAVRATVKELKRAFALRSKWQVEQLLLILKEVIKQVVESVPIEEKRITEKEKSSPEGKNLEIDYIICRKVGWNKCVREIKQWKKKMLKELEEEK